MSSGQDSLIACHACDALLADPGPLPNRRVTCPRCHTVISASRAHSIDGVIASAICTLLLMVAAMILPFISLTAGGISRDAGVIDAAIAAGSKAGWLTLAVAAMIAALPVTRALALLYVIVPVRFGSGALHGAKAAFRLAIELRPWSMVEIFIIGVGVALVKVAGLASVTLGAAFWIFVALAFIAFYEDAALCRRSVWRLIA